MRQDDTWSYEHVILTLLLQSSATIDDGIRELFLYHLRMATAAGCFQGRNGPVRHTCHPESRLNEL
jgi:hypothetical protein